MTTPAFLDRVRVIDSHTAGEPTRVVIDGGPDLGSGSLAERRALLQGKHDDFRSAVVEEPRGSDVLVGALLCKPVASHCVAGAIFFNNVGYLGMCGHAAIGVAVTLAHLGRIRPGEHQLETPVGIVTFVYHNDGAITVQNVASYRQAANVAIDVDGLGMVKGDVAWGGNWFFLVQQHGERIARDNLMRLCEVAGRIRQALTRQGITGTDDAEIDHIELFGPPTTGDADGKNFVLCPGGAYDRSPCGTGTSAKVACLIADGKLAPGEVWRQEGIVGSVFEATAEVRDGRVYPSIKGSAYVIAEATLILQRDDPYRTGIRE